MCSGFLPTSQMLRFSEGLCNELRYRATTPTGPKGHTSYTTRLDITGPREVEELYYSLTLKQPLGGDHGISNIH